MRPQATNEPLEEGLEDCSGDDTVEHAENAIIDVPEGSNADLH